MTAPTPADAARWLREELGDEKLRSLDCGEASLLSRYAAHVLGRVARCDMCKGNGRVPCAVHGRDCCPRCAGRGWTLTEAT